MSVRAIEYVRKLRGVSPTEKVVLYSIADHHNNKDNGCWPSIRLIAIESGEITDRAVQLVVRRLVEKGVIRISARRRDDGSSSSNFYEFVELPPEGAKQVQGRVNNIHPVVNEASPLESEENRKQVVVTPDPKIQRNFYRQIVKSTDTLSGVYTTKYWNQTLESDWADNTSPMAVKVAVDWVKKAMGVTGKMTLPTPSYLPALSRLGLYVTQYDVKPNDIAVVNVVQERDRVREKILYGVARQVGALIGELR